MKFWIWRWGPAGIVMMLIFIASATPGSDLPGFGAWDLITKKGGHMCGYALLASAFFHALDKKSTSARSRFFVAAGFACLYAATDEFHQRYTPGRSPSLQDVGIDALGAFIGLMVWTWISKLRRNQHPAINPDS